MALTLYTTFVTDWTHGESSTLSVHVTEQGARQRPLSRTLFCYSWDDNHLRINGLEKTHIQSFFNELADYLNYVEDICWFEYSTHTLEG